MKTQAVIPSQIFVPVSDKLVKKPTMSKSVFTAIAATESANLAGPSHLPRATRSSAEVGAELVPAPKFEPKLEFPSKLEPE